MKQISVALALSALLASSVFGAPPEAYKGQTAAQKAEKDKADKAAQAEKTEKSEKVAAKADKQRKEAKRRTANPRRRRAAFRPRPSPGSSCATSARPSWAGASSTSRSTPPNPPPGISP